MTRSPLSTVLAAVVAVTTLPLLTAPGPAAAAPEENAEPLTVTIDAMSPSVIPPRGRLTLSGVVTNRSDDTWTDLQVYLLASSTPMTTQEELDAAVESDPATEVATRITDEKLFQEIGDLAPGESARYTVSVPRRSLGVSGDPGVYWTGVHVLGASSEGRDGFADGRARTFVPLVDRRSGTTDVALVVPLRDRVRRAADGRLLGLDRWQRSLERGRLRALLDLVEASDGPLTWLLDPAILDAAASVARDNPPFATGDDGTGPEPEPEAEGSPSPEEDPAQEDPAPEDPDSVEDDTVVGASDEAEAAAAWLEDLVTASTSANVLALPYGDLDVAAVATARLSGILVRAHELSAGTTAETGIVSTPVVSPPRGLLPGRALTAVDSDVPIVLEDRAYPDAEGPVLRRRDGTEILLLDTAVAEGGPGPDDRTAPVALRQRILAEAALRSLTDDGRPLLVLLPESLAREGAIPAAGFFDGLDLRWLRQVTLSQVLVTGDEARPPGRPTYTRAARRAEVPFANQLATAELVQVGEVFANLLTRNDSVADQLAETAMLGSSVHARGNEASARQRLENTTARTRRIMRQVDVDGPPFVMMSSETGPIAVTVVNNLSEPVTVQLEARTPRDDLRVSVPGPITLEPGQRAPVRMRARSSSIGVHEVTLVATTTEGEPLGSQVQFNVRTSNVGFVIWIVMGVGGALLLVAIGWRITRRVRSHRHPDRHDPGPRDDDQPDDPGPPDDGPIDDRTSTTTGSPA